MKRGKAFFCGAAAGAANGLLGAGGGMLAVPALLRAGLTEREAHATAIAVILPASAAGGLVYLLRGAVFWGLFFPTALGVLIGGYLGAKLLKGVPVPFIGFLFSLLMAAAGVRMIF